MKPSLSQEKCVCKCATSSQYRRAGWEHVGWANVDSKGKQGNNSFKQFLFRRLGAIFESSAQFLPYTLGYNSNKNSKVRLNARLSLLWM